ncbi:MAG TPA: hypothetical protein PLN05_04795 [Pyrinomonadaceae bacterium]|nr:hypothetical protein [Chloracidobacterium sp.]HBE82037.1 hypothetical protein [Blastocatellia bacterium]HRJ87983.1 hypothetical protein [Pyrinomonadaceae bacterium]HRK49728.1 hypothetical protein [Pyrinomonadaceae bacterium]
MEIAYLHLITNHIPIIGVPFALFILAIGLIRKNDAVKQLGYLMFSLLAVATIAVYFLGQGGEDFIEELPGVAHDAIEDHEEFAVFALASVVITGLVALFGFIRYGGISFLFGKPESERQSAPGWLGVVVLLLGLLSAATLGYTGRLGGVIRHPEFHGGVQPSASKEIEKTESADRDDEDEKGRGRNRGGR